MLNKNIAAQYCFRYSLLAGLILCVAMTVAAQQKEQFTQYMFNSLILNPALAGSEEALSITFLNRRQWSNIDGAPVTQTLSAHTPFANGRTGIGLYLVNDKIGVHRNQSFQGSYSYRLRVSENAHLAMGLQAGLNVHRSDYTSLANTSSLNDPKIANGTISSTAFNIGAGLFYKTDRFEVGLSVPEIVPESTLMNDTVRVPWQRAQYFLFSRYSIPLNDMLDFEPSVLIKYMRGIPVSYDINACVFIKKVLTLGLSYRKQESVDFLLKARVMPQLQLGYAYDYGTGEVSRAGNGAHELLINYIFKFSNDNVVSPR
jgi:type IX secretion system PorP/SprF family membrane protein